MTLSDLGWFAAGMAAVWLPVLTTHLLARRFDTRR